MISIVVPIYNAIKYLPNMVNSVLSQSYKDWELVLVDDGSKDKSGLYCDELAEKDKRIKVYHTPNGGVTAARKLGAAKAHGEWIFFMDADDALIEGALRTMLKYSEECDIVIGNKKIVYGSSTVDEYINKETQIICAKDFLQGLIMNHISQFITGRMFRKELFANDTIHIPRELIMAEDFIMNVQLGNKATRIALITDFVYQYCVFEESVSHRFRSSLAYEEKFCQCLEISVKEGAYYEEVKDALTFQKVRALKAGFMSQKGKVDIDDIFIRTTREEAKMITLTRGWKLFLFLMPFKQIGYYILRIIK